LKKNALQTDIDKICQGGRDKYVRADILGYLIFVACPCVALCLYCAVI